MAMRTLVLTLALLTGACLAPVDRSSMVDVTYIVDGFTTGVDITYTDETGDIQQTADRYVPWTHYMRVPSGTFVQVSAQNQMDGGWVECFIEADDVQVDKGKSDGPYVITNCSVRV